MSTADHFETLCFAYILSELKIKSPNLNAKKFSVLSVDNNILVDKFFVIWEKLVRAHQT